MAQDFSMRSFPYRLDAASNWVVRHVESTWMLIWFAGNS
jgi:hypothetical protein